MATTDIRFENRNNQRVMEKTDLDGNHYNQKIYVLQCLRCQHTYGANGADIHLRKCPQCQGGAPGLRYA